MYIKSKRDRLYSIIKSFPWDKVSPEIFDMRIEMLDLPVRAYNVLKTSRIKTIGDMFNAANNDNHLALKNAGRRTFNDIETSLEKLLDAIPKKSVPSPIPTAKIPPTPIIRKNRGNPFYYITQSFPWDKVSPEVISVHVELLDLSVRAYNVLQCLEIRTVGDILKMACKDKHIFLRNAGRKTFKDLENSLIKLSELNLDKLAPLRDIDASDGTEQQTYTQLRFQLSSLLSINELSTNVASHEHSKDITSFPEPVAMMFVDDLKILLSSINDKHLLYMKERYGYTTGKISTLDQVSGIFGVTRERVRQIVVKTLGKLTNKGGLVRNSLNNLLDNVERVLSSYQGVVSSNDIAKDDYFLNGTKEQISFLKNILVDAYHERYKKIYKYFLSYFDDNELYEFNNKLKNSILKCQLPISEKELLQHIPTDIGTISADYLVYYLYNIVNIGIVGDNVVSLGHINIPQQVAAIMRDVDKPLHFTEIADLYKKRYANTLSRSADMIRNIHSRIAQSALFIIVGPGMFMLREKFTVPNNLSKIVSESRIILLNSGGISNTRFILRELEKRSVNTGNLNHYSLKTILMEDSRFISYRKFEIGIVTSDGSDAERLTLDEIVYEILFSAKKPLHVRDVLKEVRKNREYPEYVISQKLSINPEFIRTAPATYTVKDNVPDYESKKGLVIEFAKSWGLDKGRDISAFLVYEVLSNRPGGEGLSLSLVNNILGTSDEFIQQNTGFYRINIRSISNHLPKLEGEARQNIALPYKQA